MEIDTLAAFDDTAEILRKWIEEASRRNENLWPSEDTICFFLATSFVQKGCPVHSIEMEVPHPELEKNQGMSKNVDLRLRVPGEPVWIE